MTSVIKHDFGAEQRRAARIFARLMGLVEARDEDMLANPKKYWEIAGDRITQLQVRIDAAREALRPTVKLYDPDGAITYPHEMETLVVPRDKYERLQRCAEIIDAEVWPPKQEGD